jgi:hypothetical protein
MPQITPNRIETEILRRIAKGVLLVTMKDGRQTFVYENGVATTARMTPARFRRFVANNWIEADYQAGPTLLPGDPAIPAQVYRIGRRRP